MGDKWDELAEAIREAEKNPAGTTALARVNTAIARLEQRLAKVQDWQDSRYPCPSCGGTGKTERRRWNEKNGAYTYFTAKCRKCGGTGRHSGLGRRTSRSSGLGRGFSQGRKAGRSANLSGPRGQLTRYGEEE